MNDSIILALITLVGTIITVIATNNSMVAKLDKRSEMSDANIRAELQAHQGITDTKLDELTREVRMHNEFARRVPVLEEQMKVANHRIEDLEKK